MTVSCEMTSPSLVRNERMEEWYDSITRSICFSLHRKAS
jgi:hypothetical protein